MILKVAIWLLLGASLVVLKRRLLPEVLGWVLVAGLAATAAYLGLSNSVIPRM